MAFGSFIKKVSGLGKPLSADPLNTGFGGVPVRPGNNMLPETFSQPGATGAGAGVGGQGAGEAVGSDGYTDSQRAEVEKNNAEANATKLGEVNASRAASDLEAAGTSANKVTPLSTGGQIIDNVLSSYLERLKTGALSPGTEAVMRQGRESVALATRQANAQAGASAAKSDALGQGTQQNLADTTRQSALGALAQGEQDNAKLASDDQMALQKVALDSAQMERQFEQQTSQGYIQALSAVAAENPVLAAKLSNALLAWDGKSPFKLDGYTPEEQQQLKDLAAKNKKLDDILFQNAEAEANRLGEGQGGTTQLSTIQGAIQGRDLSKLTNLDLQTLVKDPTSLRAAQDAGILPAAPYATKSVNIKNYESNPRAKNLANYQAAYADLKPGQIIQEGGKYYKVVTVGVQTSEGGGAFGKNTRGRVATKAINLETGEEENILQSGRFDVD